jgi:nucleotide-binding universal stress UspA family protein
LLVPIDLTPISDRVLGRISLLPLADEAQITLLHVIPGGLTVRERRQVGRDVAKAFPGEARHLRQALPKNVVVDPVVTAGDVAKEIGTIATRVGAELIVMGRCKRRALREAFLGSTAERVVRQAQLPVLVVRLPPRAPYGRPALALDFDQAASAVIQLMLRVLPTPRPRITLIHAFDDPYRGLGYPGLPKEDAEEREAVLRYAASKELETLVAAALAKAHVDSDDAPRLHTHVRYGSARHLVEQAVARAGTDLLMLGTRGHSGPLQVFLGTVAGDLLRAVKSDVLVVPPRRSRS